MTQMFESRSRKDSGFTGDIVHGKETLIPDNEVMAYPEILGVVHEFAARLQFGTTFEVMEFLADSKSSCPSVWWKNTQRCR